jgi:hypothetical protein
MIVKRSIIQLCYAGDLLTLLHVSSDEKILPTTYGELRPPLGKHRLKVGLFIYYKFNRQDKVEPKLNFEVEWSETNSVGCHMS